MNAYHHNAVKANNFWGILFSKEKIWEPIYTFCHHFINKDTENFSNKHQHDPQNIKLPNRNAVDLSFPYVTKKKREIMDEREI